jgi:hypothetical protein
LELVAEEQLAKFKMEKLFADAKTKSCLTDKFAV